MENLNAEKVKKALKIHTGILDEACEECPYNRDPHDEICLDVLVADTLNIITSQEQRIKELTAKITKLEEECDLRGDMWCKLNEENKRLTEENEAISKRYAIQVVTAIELDKQVQRLTEENERLRADVAKEFTCVFGTPHKVSNCPIDDEIAKAKADTVRKMQERLMQKILENTVGNDSFAYFFEDYIDQIAKEILEEGE